MSELIPTDEILGRGAGSQQNSNRDEDDDLSIADLEATTSSYEDGTFGSVGEDLSRQLPHAGDLVELRCGSARFKDPMNNMD
jgi:hypothetical protein